MYDTILQLIQKTWTQLILNFLFAFFLFIYFLPFYLFYYLLFFVILPFLLSVLITVFSSVYFHFIHQYCQPFFFCTFQNLWKHNRSLKWNKNNFSLLDYLYCCNIQRTTLLWFFSFKVTVNRGIRLIMFIQSLDLWVATSNVFLL